MFFVREKETAIVEALATGAPRELVGYHELPNGEAIAISTHCAPCSRDNIVADRHEGPGIGTTLLFPASDELSTGRPYRISIASTPKDGDCLELWDFGGFAQPDGYEIDNTVPWSRIGRHAVHAGSTAKGQ